MISQKKYCTDDASITFLLLFRIVEEVRELMNTVEIASLDTEMLK